MQKSARVVLFAFFYAHAHGFFVEDPDGPHNPMEVRDSLFLIQSL